MSREELKKLESVQGRHPNWDVIPVFGGWQASPRGTPVVRSLDLDGIDEKISAVERDEPSGL